MGKPIENRCGIVKSSDELDFGNIEFIRGFQQNISRNAFISQSQGQLFSNLFASAIGSSADRNNRHCAPPLLKKTLSLLGETPRGSAQGHLHIFGGTCRSKSAFARIPLDILFAFIPTLPGRAFCEGDYRALYQDDKKFSLGIKIGCGREK
jgi:hypothetical protein